MDTLLALSRVLAFGGIGGVLKGLDSLIQISFFIERHIWVSLSICEKLRIVPKKFKEKQNYSILRDISLTTAGGGLKNRGNFTPKILRSPL